MNFIRIYKNFIKLYDMKARKKTQKDPYRLNKQLENAYNWLRSNKYIRTAAELASKWGVSKSTVSEYLSMNRRLGLANASTFEYRLLRKHNLTLKSFTTNILVQQAELAGKPSSQDIASLFATQLLRLEGGQEITLDKLAELEIKIGELRDLVTKLIEKAV